MALLGLTLGGRLAGAETARANVVERAEAAEKKMEDSKATYRDGLLEIEKKVCLLEQKAIIAKEAHGKAEREASQLRTALAKEQESGYDLVAEREKDAAAAWGAMSALGRSFGMLDVCAPEPAHLEADIRSSLEWIRSGAAEVDNIIEAYSDNGMQVSWRGAFLALQKAGCTHLSEAMTKLS